MNIFGHEPSFWIAVAGATVFKLLTSQNLTPRQALITVGSAVLAAWLATDALIAFMEWDAETYKAPTAAIIALVGENIMRNIVTLDLDKIIKTIKELRS